MSDQHLARRLEKALADDERTNELGITVRADADRIVAQGEVASDERRQTVLEVLQELEPEQTITDHLTVSADEVAPPSSREAIQQR